MKKIIATVLAMVMALALCTTAFAANAITDKADVVNPSNEDTIASTVTWNNTKKDLKAVVADGHDTYWTATGNLYYVWNKDSGKFIQITDAQQAIIAAGYTDTKVIVKEIAAAATCEDDGYNVTVYTNLDENAKYVKVDDVDAFNKKQTVESDKMVYDEDDIVYFGTSYTNAIAYLGVNDVEGNDLPAGHILVKDGTTYGTAKADVYKCALCGGRFVTVLNSETGSLKSEYYAANNTAAVAAYAAKNGIVSSKLVKTATTLYTVEAGKTTGTTTNTNKPSPKTFDAGIAMYVGMALTSVAGSAVVIGKKKEF